MLKALEEVTLLFSYVGIDVSTASTTQSLVNLDYMCVVQPPKGNGNHKAVSLSKLT